MKTFNVLLRKEFTEITRTWRLPTVAGALLFFAVMSPLAALAAPALVKSLTASQPGVVIQIPDPTFLDSYVQWIKNLSQMGLLVVVFSAAGLFASERTSGTAALVASKPVSAQAFAWAKYVAHAALVAGAVAVGTLVTLVGTRLAFGEAPVGPLLSASVVWLAGALVALAITEALSAALPVLAAGVVALVAYGVAGAAALWQPIAAYTFAGLFVAPGAALSGERVAIVLPLACAALTVLVLVSVAGWTFSHREM
jgi:ABC-2 type transport system permease protein